MPLGSSPPPPAAPASPSPLSGIGAASPASSPLAPTLSGSTSPPPKLEEVPAAKKPETPKPATGAPSEPTAKADLNPKEVSPKQADNSLPFSPLSPPPATNKPVDNVPPLIAPAPASPAPPAPASGVKPPKDGTYFIPDPSSSANGGGNAPEAGAKAIGAVPAPLSPPPMPVLTPLGGVSATDAGRVRPSAASSPPAQRGRRRVRNRWSSSTTSKSLPADPTIPSRQSARSITTMPSSPKPCSDTINSTLAPANVWSTQERSWRERKFTSPRRTSCRIATATPSSR